MKNIIHNYKIVWILNLSPDSFSDWRVFSKSDLKERIQYLIDSWADIIDVGAESTAPWSVAISLEEELRRFELFFELLREDNFQFSVCNFQFSIDTMKSEVARKGIGLWVKMINDVSWGRFDNKMFDLIAETWVGYILMYCANKEGRTINTNKKNWFDNKNICRDKWLFTRRDAINRVSTGDPWSIYEPSIEAGSSVGSDLKSASSQDIIKDINTFFKEVIALAKNKWIQESQIVIDPWMWAFLSEDFQDSIKVLKWIWDLKKKFKLPVFIWTSRKWFLWKISKDSGPSDRLWSSLASSYFALSAWADYIRVHDVKEFKQLTQVLWVLNL